MSDALYAHSTVHIITDLGLGGGPPELSVLAENTSPGADGVYLVPAYGGLLAPRWRDDARGTVVGLSLAHTKEHLARAALEGIAYQVDEVLTAMAADAELDVTTMRVDGGVCKSEVLLQFQADLVGASVERPTNVETTALGAALCAGIGADAWKLADITDEVAASDRMGQPVLDCVFEPSIDEGRRIKLRGGWDRAVKSSYGWA